MTPPDDDARFADAPAPLRLKAETAEDLAVLAAVLQDAVVRVSDTAWMPRRHRFAAVVNRFRWEAHRPGSPGERVRAGLAIEHVRRVRAQGFDPAARDRVLAVLDLSFEQAVDGAGTLSMVLAGGASVVFEVEALEVSVSDLSQPWPARGVPGHG